MNEYEGNGDREYNNGNEWDAENKFFSDKTSISYFVPVILLKSI